MATPSISIKRGASLQLLIQASNDDGSPFDLTGVVITSQVRTEKLSLVATLTTTLTAVPGQFSVRDPTTGWPVGALSCDIKLTSPDGVVLKSDTFMINVLLAITS